MLPPLLTQRAFDEGLFPASGAPNLPVLTELVGLMIAIYILSAGLGVWQTWLTASVGNQVMGSLRVRLFDHLPIHPHPAAFNVLLRLAARTRNHFSKTFSEADRFGHEVNAVKEWQVYSGLCQEMLKRVNWVWCLQ